MRKGKIIWVLIYLIFGLYFINSAFPSITLPSFIIRIDKWMVFIGAILIFIGGINYLRAGKKTY